MLIFKQETKQESKVEMKKEVKPAGGFLSAFWALDREEDALDEKILKLSSVLPMPRSVAVKEENKHPEV